MSIGKHLATFNLFREADHSLHITIADARGVRDELGESAAPLYFCAMNALYAAVDAARRASDRSGEAGQTPQAAGPEGRERGDAEGGRRPDSNSSITEELRKALEDAHTAMAVAIAFCNRGPRPEKIGRPAPASSWAEMCGEIAVELSKADQTALAALKSLPSQRPVLSETGEQGAEPIVTLQLRGRPVDVDGSLAPIVLALNEAGVETIASCSGHGHRPGNIALRDGREIIIARNHAEGRRIDSLFPAGSNGEIVKVAAEPVLNGKGLAEDVVETAVAAVNERFPGWKPTEAMLGYARAVGKAVIEGASSC